MSAALYLTCVRHRMIFFAGLELKHVARPVESYLPISIRGSIKK